MIKSGFSITAEDVAAFQKQGFLKLRGLFSDELVEHIRQLSTAQVTAPADNYGKGFSRLKYDIGNDDETILALMGDPDFAGGILQLTGTPLFFTQGLGFELEKNKSTGFPWHVGTQSFGFQHRQDLGYTIWMPLCEIDPHGQRGGMAYISREFLSGEFVYQHINLLPSYLQKRMSDGHEVTFETFSELKNSLLNSPQMKQMLDHYAVEDHFEPGDALIFDKYVLHRSVRLEEGPIPSRLAYALRFSSLDATYDKQRVDSLAFPRVSFNYDVGSPFNDRVASLDGESIYHSPYFDGSREARTLHLARVPQHS